MPGIGIGLGLGMGAGRGRPSLYDRVLAEFFGSGEPGVYMPSVHEAFLRGDLYQDSAGTTAVTAVGQPVGLFVDRSGNGKNAAQGTSGSRPLLQQDDNGIYLLRFDGSNDGLVMSSVDFTSTDKMTVIVGARKVGASGIGTLIELSADAGQANGSFAIFAPENTVHIKSYARSTTNSNRVATGEEYAAPLTFTARQKIDLGAATHTLVVNGTAISGETGSTGTAGNFSSNNLYVGRRNNSTHPFNGDIYGWIVCGAEKSDELCALAESLIMSVGRIIPPGGDALLMETGDYLLLESGDLILLED